MSELILYTTEDGRTPKCVAFPKDGAANTTNC
jgi:hypothetical protein